MSGFCVLGLQMYGVISFESNENKTLLLRLELQTYKYFLTILARRLIEIKEFQLFSIHGKKGY
jgi:hypothetical protein